MNKQVLVEQLADKLRESAHVARAAASSAAEQAKNGATPMEKTQDARVAIEFSTLASAQQKRMFAAKRELAALEGFRPAQLRRRDPIALGALVEIEDEDTGEGRTVFLAPVGAGVTLTGPGGDGLFSVVTPASPMGKAMLGRRVGDIIDVRIAGDVRELAITYVA